MNSSEKIQMAVSIPFQSKVNKWWFAIFYGFLWDIQYYLSLVGLCHTDIRDFFVLHWNSRTGKCAATMFYWCWLHFIVSNISTSRTGFINISEVQHCQSYTSLESALENCIKWSGKDFEKKVDTCSQCAGWKVLLKNCNWVL